MSEEEYPTQQKNSGNCTASTRTELIYIASLGLLTMHQEKQKTDTSESVGCHLILLYQQTIMEEDPWQTYYATNKDKPPEIRPFTLQQHRVDPPLYRQVSVAPYNPVSSTATNGPIKPNGCLGKRPRRISGSWRGSRTTHKLSLLTPERKRRYNLNPQQSSLSYRVQLLHTKMLYPM